jgi:putative CocE/NonD family hydrolase
MRKILPCSPPVQLFAFCLAVPAVARSAGGSLAVLRNAGMRKLLGLIFLLLIAPICAPAQQLDFKHAATADPAELVQAMPALARAVIAAYHDDDRGKYLDNLFRLQIVAGDYAGAKAGIERLRALLKESDPVYANITYAQYEIFSDAKLRQAEGRIVFDDAFREAFRAAYDRMSDKEAYRASGTFSFDPAQARDDLRAALEGLKGKDKIDLPTALGLVRRYQPYQVYQSIAPLAQSLTREDDDRRYVIHDNVLIKTKDGATVSAIVVRKRGVNTPQPAALTFTIYADTARNFSAPRFAAANGYVGVAAFTRGKAASPDEIVPYEYDGRDANAVIDWITKQPWSDGRVGMYGGSYGGFTSWAAAKHLHPALKTIVPYAATNPGDGLPMENNIFLLVNYAWAFYVMGNKYLDNKVYSDTKRWNDLNNNWYLSGKPYRQVDGVDGTPNPWLQRSLRHPSYDKYWQDMVPYKEDFAKIKIPVLTITGYYDDAQQSAIHYLKEHYKYDKNADHYLLIGPYDHFGSQSPRKPPVLNGYAIDRVAQFDTPEITFRWLDYVMRGGKKPELLKDKINYEVMGGNVWKHVPTLEAASNETLTLYLSDAKLIDAKASDRYRLSREKPARPGSTSQTVDFADRKTSTNLNYYPAPVVLQNADLSTDGVTFVSGPFEEPVEISGTFSGEIRARLNKRDMDYCVALYELMPNGDLFHLSYFMGRAGYARDMSVRRLLTPGAVESIPFDKTRMVSRRIGKGSRLLVTLSVNKSPFAQINYGTGKDVSDEDISDAKETLRVEWRNDSYVKIPVWR